MARFKDKDVILGTNEEVLFGNAQEASIKYDGSDLIIDKLPYHITKGYLATQGYVDMALMGLEWQDSVLSVTTDIPAGVYGERYIIPSGASGDWTGRDDTIAEYTTTWVYTVPSAGYATFVEDEGAYFVYSGSIWVRMGTVIDHGLLDGLADDDHTQYLTTGRHDTTARHGSSVVDHGLIGGLDDDDHVQYFLADGSRDLTGTLTISGSEGYISEIVNTNTTTQWFFDPTNAVVSSGLDIYIDGVSSSTNRVFSISKDTLAIEANVVITDHYLQVRGDEGADGLIYLYADDGDDQEDWWRLRAGNDGLFAIQNYFGGWVDAIYIDDGTNLTVTGDVSAASFYGDGTRITGLITDHSELTGLSDDDHPIYLPSDGSRAMTGTLTVNTTGGYMRFSGLTANIGLASDIDMINLSGVGVTIDNNLTVTGSLSADHDTLLGLTDDDHSIYLNTTRHDTTDRHGAASVDHGLIDGLTDDDHPQYFLLTGTRSVSGDILPFASDTYDIGKSDAVWDDIWCQTLHASAGSIVLGTTTLTDVGGVLTSDSEFKAPSGTDADSFATQQYVTEQTDITITAALTAGIIPGTVARGRFIYKDANEVYANAATYHHAGTLNQIVTWDSQLTKTVLSDTGWNYLYLDDSAIVTAGTNLLTATELIFSTTAPTWSDTKYGLYNGNDRCIFATFNTGASTQAEFFHDGGDLFMFADEIADLALTDIDTTWTDVTLTIPGFCTKADVTFNGNSTDSFANWSYWRTNDQTGATGHKACNHEHDGDVMQTSENNCVVVTDSSQIIEVKLDVTGNAQIAVNTNGWYFPAGM